MQCPKCKKEFEDGLRFCDSCGTKLRDETNKNGHWECLDCGTVVKKEDNKCPKCGCVFEDGNDVDVEQKRWGGKRRNKNIFQLSNIIACIIIISIPTLVAIFLFKNWMLNNQKAGIDSDVYDSKEPTTMGLTIKSYGHTNRGYFGDNLEVSFHVRLHNQTDKRIPGLYVEYRWLDKNNEQLAYSNETINLGPDEEITATDRTFIEPRLYQQTRNIGILLSAPSANVRTYKILPALEER